MALTTATNDLTGNTIASTYDQILFIDGAAITNSTLYTVAAQAGETALRVANDQILIKDSSGTDIASCFEVQDKDGTICLSVNGTNNRVGIGTAAPASILEIADANGVDLIFGDLAAAPASATACYIGISEAGYTGTNGDLVLASRTSGGANSSIILLPNGEGVGIGTTAPISLLDVQGGTGTGFTGAGKLSLTTAELTIVDNDVLGIIQFEASLESSATDAALPAAAIWAEAEATFAADNNSCALVFATANSENALATAQERMRIDNTGKVGIGIAPATPLHVRSDSGAEGVVRFENNEGTVETADAILVCDYSDDTDVDGAAMISFEDETAEVGSISVDADTTSYNTSSDYRLKTDLKDIADAIGTIKKLKLYDFAWKKNEQKRGMGVLAHEAQAIVPQAIKGIKDAMGIKRYTEDGVKKTRETIRPQQADYSQFVPLLLKAIQELSAKVDALENNNNEQGDSSNEQEQEGSDSGVSSSESTGQDSGGYEGNNSDSSGAASGASEASDSSSNDGNESAGSSGSDASDDSEGGSGADDSTGSEGESSGDSGSDSVDDG